jgi:hypothetical protein
MTTNLVIKYKDVNYYFLLISYDKYNYFTFDISRSFDGGRLHNIAL